MSDLFWKDQQKLENVMVGSSPMYAPVVLGEMLVLSFWGPLDKVFTLLYLTFIGIK